MRKGKGKEKKRGKRKAAALLWQSRICIPCVTELNEERLIPFRELNNFKIRGSAGQKAPL